MKKLPLLLLALTCFTGCFSRPEAKPHYSVGLEEIRAQDIEFPQFKTLKLTLENDIQAMYAPYVFHNDGRVTLYTALTYYAPLPIALERAIKDNIVPTATIGEVPHLKLTLTDYAIDLRKEKPFVFVGIRSNAAYITHEDGRRTLQTKIPEGLQTLVIATVELPIHYTPQDVRQAFARALLIVCDSLY